MQFYVGNIYFFQPDAFPIAMTHRWRGARARAEQTHKTRALEQHNVQLASSSPGI